VWWKRKAITQGDNNTSLERGRARLVINKGKELREKRTKRVGAHKKSSILRSERGRGRQEKGRADIKEELRPQIENAGRGFTRSESY